MHYGDKEQVDNNELVIVAYKHSTSKNGVFDYMVTSIQKCQYFPPMLLTKILKNPNKYLDFLKSEDAEEWYLITMKCLDGYNDIETLNVKKVSNIVSSSIFLKLH